ncbi:hypothetical protein [Oceanicaulis sp.]|uniref:hypothetical protein n=1 Tax=Oceanicaulis sp. TaxID=1924941 RepID=UPI003D2BBDA3
MTESYTHEYTFTTSDFKIMGWSCCRLYSLRMPDQSLSISLDIDYILEGLTDIDADFLILPSLLKFENINHFEASQKWDILKDAVPTDIRMIECKTLDKRTPHGQTLYEFKIDTDFGHINVCCTGFTQTPTQKPIWSPTMNLNR